MKIDDEILYNIVSEFRRKDIDKHKKAEFIRAAMKETGLSNRKFSARFDIPLTTLKDWLCYDKITPQQHKELIQAGLKETEVFRAVRNTPEENLPRVFVQKITESKGKAVYPPYEAEKKFHYQLDADLRTCIDLIKVHVRNPRKDEDTIDLIIELQNMLSTIRERIGGRR